MADPEIDVLWHGEWILRELLDSGCYHVPHARLHDLELLIGELERIRKMRVARWQQREKAKQMKRARLVRANQRGDARVRQLMSEAKQRAESGPNQA